jgi:hypothetical protein
MVASPYHRRFTLLDAMILILATGASVASVRTDLADLWAELRSISVHELTDLAYVQDVMFAHPHSLHRRSVLGIMGRYVGSAIHGGPPTMLLRPKGQAVAIADDLAVISLSFLVLLTLAIAILRLCRPRPPWSDLVWQPGLWACGAAVITLDVLFWTELYYGSNLPPEFVPCSVIIAWLVLAASRHCSPEASWIDRAGRFLGIAWIGLFPVHLVLRFWGF